MTTKEYDRNNQARSHSSNHPDFEKCINAKINFFCEFWGVLRRSIPKRLHLRKSMIFLEIFLNFFFRTSAWWRFCIKGVFSWIGRISKRCLEFYCERTIIDFLMRLLLKVLLTLRLQNSENLYEKICTVWSLHPCEHRPSKKSWLMVPTC